MASWLNRSPSEGTPDAPGQVIREYRLAARRSQADLAAAVGITQQRLSQIEKTTDDLSFDLRRRFAEALSIPPEELGLAPRIRSATPYTDKEVAASRGLWRAQRRWLNQNRAVLAERAAEWYPDDIRLPRTPLIAHAHWIPDQPTEIDSVDLALIDQPEPVKITGRESTTLPMRPLRTADQHFDSYSSAIRHLDPPQLFESRPSYRFTGGSIAGGAMKFGMAAYFDKLDLSEALAHEMVLGCMGSGIPASAGELNLPFRESIADPFDPMYRAIIPAITTLTIRLRRYPEPPSFLLHWRDPAKVATAAGVYDVIPAGEFQPSTVAIWDRSNDFSFWRNMVREYSEELLGTPEHDGTRSDALDYENWGLYRTLSDARKSGKVNAAILGMGLDALTLAATILTVVVIDDDVFSDLFGQAVRVNDEGEIVTIGDGRATEGVPFTAEAVERLLETEPLAAPGAAALALAWEHRNILI